jgi:hypothetical protein
MKGIETIVPTPRLKDTKGQVGKDNLFGNFRTSVLKLLHKLPTAYAIGKLLIRECFFHLNPSINKEQAGQHTLKSLTKTNRNQLFLIFFYYGLEWEHVVV